MSTKSLGSFWASTFSPSAATKPPSSAVKQTNGQKFDQLCIDLADHLPKAHAQDNSWPHLVKLEKVLEPLQQTMPSDAWNKLDRQFKDVLNHNGIDYSKEANLPTVDQCLDNLKS
ncbi:hypothetical protein [Simkania sp.]|uniref:hypothetical protein n=1 Tax=Simkania sp. TaxID=34094 RepID=UPI003B52F05B